MRQRVRYGFVQHARATRAACQRGDTEADDRPLTRVENVIVCHEEIARSVGAVSKAKARTSVWTENAAVAIRKAILPIVFFAQRLL
jgi:hypothetical protein